MISIGRSSLIRFNSTMMCSLASDEFYCTLFWQEHQRVLEEMGILVQMSSIVVQTDKFYLVDFNTDP